MKNKRVFLICLAVTVILIVSIVFAFAPTLPSGYGRRVSFVFPDGITIQAPPPRQKLIHFMNKKYGVKFKEYEGIAFKEYGFRYSHASSAEGFDKYYNGIIVSTKEYPDHYFYVCDQYGEIHDDYGCHFAEQKAEQILKDELSDVINYELKVTLHPNFYQEKVFSAMPEGRDYLENGEYIIKIFIRDKGENAEAEFKKISETVRPYWDKHCFMFIYYLNDSAFDLIEPEDYRSYCGNIIYYKMGQGWGYDDSGKIYSWEWIE